MNEAPARPILLCADDYGISPAVSAAIRDLILRRRLNATSVMVVAPSFHRPEAVSLDLLNAGDARAAVGLHVTLTAPFRPIGAGFKPVRDGVFLPLQELFRRALLRTLSRKELEAEIAAQLEAFSNAFGRAPDFVDGHQHVQLFPQVRDAVLSVVKAAAPGAWVRQCGRAPTPVRRPTTGAPPGRRTPAGAGRPSPVDASLTASDPGGADVSAAGADAPAGPAGCPVGDG